MLLNVSLLQDAGWVAWIQLAAIVFGVLWTLVCAVLLGLRKKVPPVLSAGFLGLHALLVVLGAFSGATMLTEASAAVDPAQRSMLHAMAVSRGLTSAALAVAVIPSALLLSLGGMAGGVRAPRRFIAPVLAFLACGAAALLPIGGLLMDATLATVAIKVLLYGAGAIPVAASLLCAGQDTNGRESAMAATIAFFCVVASVELAAPSFEWMRAFSAVAHADTAQKGTILRYAAEEIGGPAALGWGSIALAGVPMLIAALRPSLPLTEEEILGGRVGMSPGRTMGLVLGFGVPLLWLLARLLADPTDAMSGLMAMYPAGP